MTSDAADRDWLDGAMRRVFADDDRVARTVARLDAADRDGLADALEMYADTLDGPGQHQPESENNHT